MDHAKTFRRLGLFCESLALCIGVCHGLCARAAPAQIPSEGNSLSSIPYSYQWTYERPRTSIALILGTESLARPKFSSSGVSSDFGDGNVTVIGLDSFSPFFHFASPEGNAFFKKLAASFRYGVGAGVKQGTVSDRFGTLNFEHTSLVLLDLRLGVALEYELSSWIQPNIGFSLAPYFYRISSTVSGAELEHVGYGTEISGGLRAPLFFDHRLSLVLNARHKLAQGSNNPLFAEKTSWDAGIGMVF
ncbi:MAG: hypothetical protein H7301_09025 [Cryobacterium sp.]|nr:hypothetical protein [Oligoflexia bacterium]